MSPNEPPTTDDDDTVTLSNNHRTWNCELVDALSPLFEFGVDIISKNSSFQDLFYQYSDETVCNINSCSLPDPHPL